jgi:hypothetical protein
MKQIISICLIIIIAAFWQACDSESRYIDPNTGSSLNLREDTATGLMVDKETGKPVSMYVDTKNDDTIYGRTGKVINGKIRRNKATQLEMKLTEGWLGVNIVFQVIIMTCLSSFLPCWPFP